jgi:hypothetical protein
MGVALELPAAAREMGLQAEPGWGMAACSEVRLSAVTSHLQQPAAGRPEGCMSPSARGTGIRGLPKGNEVP